MPVDLALLAHQGGWDEILLVAGPIVVIVGLLRVAKNRVDAAAAAGLSSADGQPGRADSDRDETTPTET